MSTTSFDYYLILAVGMVYLGMLRLLISNFSGFMKLILEIGLF